MKRPLRLLPAVATVLVLAVAPVASAANFPATIPLPLGFSPEGITTGAGNRIYVGSLAGGAIWAGNARTGLGTVIAPAAQPGSRFAVGLDYEDRTGRLWVAGGPLGEVHVFDSRTGALLHTYTVPGAHGFLNDVVVTDDAAYITDSNVQQLIVIHLSPDGSLPPDSALSKVPLTGAITYTGGFNANGIVAARGWLIVVQSNTGKLFRVNPTTGVTIEIVRNTSGFTTAEATIQTGDGLELRGSTLYVVRNNADGSTSEAVLVHRLGPGLTTARLLGSLTSPALDVPTTATLAAGRLWVVNARFTTPATPSTAYWITRLPSRP